MSKDNSSTVLSEHSRIFSLRHILAIFNFLIILTCTIVTIALSARKGAPVSVYLFLYFLLVINIGQIGVCIADYVLKQHFGFYTKWLTISSYILGGLWLVMLIGELIAASVAFSILRLDLLILSLIQFVIAFSIYIIWPYLDRKSIDAMIRPSVRDDSVKKNLKFRMFVGIYIAFCVILTLVQIFALFIYRMPPKLYDLFSDTRAIEYKQDGDGYVVTKVYSGTSSVVNIPATYNNRPVTGIATGAIDDSELIEKYRISEITLGTVERDADGNQKTVSYLKYIQSGAIVNDKIESLVIPDTVEQMETGAISSNSLKMLQYEGRADFSFSYLKCNSLSTLLMSGDNVGKLVSIEGKSANCEILVSKDIYNQYRQDNYEYMSYFVPILDEGEFCVDFYSGCDYYIESIISDGKVVELKYSDLSNPNMKGIAPSVDTLAYIKDDHELGTNGAKANSAFRGWYFDKNFTEPCAFTESASIKISRSRSIYAKWIDEYNAKLNWGTFQPVNTDNSLYWTDEDEKVLPVITNRTGYAAGIQWATSDTQKTVTTTKGISRNINFNGTWLLDAPDIKISLNYDISDPDFRVSRQQDNVTFTYDENRSLPLVADLNHVMGNNSISYSYYWEKTSGEESNLEKVDAAKDSFGHSIQDMGITVRNVRQSGVYALLVTATAKNYGEKSTAQTAVTVTINKKDLSIGEAYYNPNYEYTYTAKHIFRTVESNIASDVRPEYLYSNDDTGNITNGQQGIINTGTYTVSATFAKINADERDNYNTKTISTSVTIKPAPLEYVGWYIDNDNWNDSIVYDGRIHTYNLKIDGELGNDDVSVLYEAEGHSEKDAATYTVKVTGVDNSNYTLDEINQANLNSEWTIEQRPVTVHLWQVNNSLSQNQENSFVYDGTEHSVSAVMSGRVTGDDVDFVYDSQSAFVMKATVVGDYRALITGVNNSNYYFNINDESAQFDWSITERSIYADFNVSPMLYYNAEEQGITANITNIAPSDVLQFTHEMFDFNGSSSVLSFSSAQDDKNSKLTIAFKAVNANTEDTSYTANIAGLVSQSLNPLLENYKLEFIGSATEDGLSSDFTIRPKTITFDYGKYVYSSAEQELKLRVVGIESKDLDAGVDFDLFTTTAIEGRREGNYYCLTYTGLQAQQYPVSVTAFANTNYTMSAYSDNITIDRKRLTLSQWRIKDESKSDAATERLLTGDVKNYNFNGYTVSAVLEGIFASDENLITYGLTYTNDFVSQTNEYVTGVSLDETEFVNYTFNTQSINWAIEPYVIKDLEWNISGENLTGGVVYDGTEKGIAYDFTRLGNDVVSITYTNLSVTTATDAGSYPVTVKGTDNPNYILNEDYAFNWQINPAPVTVNWHAAPSYVYSGQYQSPSFSLSGIVAKDNEISDDMTVHIAYSASGVTSSETLSGNRSQTLTAANNYYFNDSDTGFAVDAGSYQMSVTHVTINRGSNIINGNYTIVPTSSSKSFTIAKKAISLSGNWNYSNSALGVTNALYTDSEITVYNAMDYTVTTTLADGGLVKRLNSSSVDNVNLVYAENVHSEAGNYTAKVSGLSGTYANNYSLSATGVSLAWKIDKKVLKFDWDFVTTTYSASNQTNKASFSSVSAANAKSNDGKVIIGTNVTLSCEDNVKRNVGTYTAKVTALSNGNYTFDNSSNSTCEWTIDPLPVSMSWNYTSAYTYNGGIQHPEAKYGVGEDAGLTTGITYSGDIAVKNYNAGGYTITVSKIDNANYTLEGGSNLSCAYMINQLPVIFSWSMTDDNTSKALSGWTYDGKTREVNATVYNACAGDTFIYVYKDSPSRQYKDAGSYTLTVTSVTNNNYTLIKGSDITCSFTVDRRVATLTWQRDATVVTADTAITYDGSSHSLTATVSNVCAGDTVNVEYNGGNSWTDASKYSVTVSGLSDTQNYRLGTDNISRSLTINKQPVEITWSGSQTVSYDGSPHSLTATVKGKNDGKAVSFKYANGNSQTNQGTYTFTVNSLDNSNYTLDSVVTTVNLTINPVYVGLRWSDYSGTYDGSSHSATATVTGAVNNETVTVTGYSLTSATNAGNYKVTALSLSSTNYVISDDVGGSIIILPQKVVLNWTLDGETYVSNKTYDGKTHTLKAAVTGVDDGKAVKNFIESTANAGIIDVSVTDLGNTNYTLDGCTGATYHSFTIDQKAVTTTWTNLTEIYDSYSHSLTPMFNGVLSGHDLRPVYSITSGSTTSAGNSAFDAGTYTVRVVSFGNTNYTLTSNNAGMLTIEKQKVSIVYYCDGVQHDDLSQYTYNGYDQTLEVGVWGQETGAYLNNAVTITLKKSGTAVANATYAGVYTYTVSNITNNNYTLEGADTEKTQTINKASVYVSWDRNYDYYNGTYTVTATVVSATTYKSVSVKSYKIDDASNATSTVSISEPGVHTVTLYELDDPNHTLDGVSDLSYTFTITDYN